MTFQAIESDWLDNPTEVDVVEEVRIEVLENGRFAVPGDGGDCR